MASDDSYEGYVPSELKGYLNFGSNLVFIFMGYFFRLIGRLKDDHIPGIHLLTFTLCLPALMICVLWSGTIAVKSLEVLPASAVTQSLWCMTVSMILKYTKSESNGLYAMASTGNALAYVYPAILGSKRFGPAAVGVVVMWELGGNMVVAVICHSIMAQVYAPVVESSIRGPVLQRGESFAWAQLTPRDLRPVVVGNVLNPSQSYPASQVNDPTHPQKLSSLVPVPEESAPPSTNLAWSDPVHEIPAPASESAREPVVMSAKSASISGTRPRSLSQPLGIEPGSSKSTLPVCSAWDQDLESLGCSSEEASEPDSPTKSKLLSQWSHLHPSAGAAASADNLNRQFTIEMQFNESSTIAKAKNLLAPALKTPLLWGVFVGLALNRTGIPFYPIPAMALRALTGAFPPLLYFLLGASLRFNISLAAYGTVFRVLLARVVTCAMATLFVRFVYPLHEQTRSVITLCLAAPITTTFVMFSSQNGYKMDMVAMIKNVSDITSLVLLNFLTA